ncbi:MAG: hypothetical protein LLG04_06260 [Parachlamydia sp.]|nr:hypothetical protein [Parachlamydia sp.]
MARVAHQITLFTIIDTSSFLHLNCDTEKCIKLGGDICITRELAEYLKTQKRIQQAYPGRYGNDWDHLTSKDPDVLNDLSSPEFYRLRFKKHSEIGKQYVKDTLLKHPSIWENQDLSHFWGSPLKMTYKDCRLDLLFLRAETQSVGAIYRLYDILDGASPNTKRFKFIDFLSLLFALGHGKDMPLCAESISELLAGFQFFKAFSFKKQAGFRIDFTKKKAKKPTVDVETETSKKLTAYSLSAVAR